MSTQLDAAIGEILIDEETLAARVAELGAEVSADYEGRDLLLIGVLKGAVFFMADLMRHLTVACEVDFMAISSYGDATDSSGIVRILKDLDISIEGRDVLVVEDIIDSGLTLSYLMRNLESRAPASLEVCALMTKPGNWRLSSRLIQIISLVSGAWLPSKVFQSMPSRPPSWFAIPTMLLTKVCDFVRFGKLMPLPAPPTDRMILRPCTLRAYARSAFQLVAAPRPLPGRLK